MIYLFDATGNRILLYDARAVSLPPYHLIDTLIRDTVSIQEIFLPEIYAIVSVKNKRIHVDFWNPDLSHESLCGNALRCLPSVLEKKENSHKQKICIKTPYSPVWICSPGHNTGMIEINEADIQIEALSANKWFINPGTPHLVIIINNINSEKAVHAGEKWSKGSSPVNVTLVKITSQELHLRTFERGVGETASCGSGAIAAFLSYKHYINYKAGDELYIQIRFLSGHLLYVAQKESSKRICLWGHYKIKGILNYHNVKGINNGLHYHYLA